MEKYQINCHLNKLNLISENLYQTQLLKEIKLIRPLNHTSELSFPRPSFLVSAQRPLDKAKLP